MFYYKLMMAFWLIATLALCGLVAQGYRKKIYEHPENRRKNSLYWSARLFAPALLIIFISKTFIMDWAYVPSPSMWPTVASKQYIFATKYNYNLFFQPFTETSLGRLGSPERGDAITFLYPEDEKIIYLKRVVAVPGDTIEYTPDKKIKIITQTGETINYAYGEKEKREGTRMAFSFRVENTGKKSYKTALIDNIPAVTTVEFRNFPNFPMLDCAYRTAEGFRCTLPADKFFVMGDNRDQSLDSRFWGFVSGDKITAKAQYVCDFVSIAFMRLPQCRAI